MWYQEKEEGLVLFVKIIPGSSQNRIIGVINGDFLKIKIAAPPEKGRANSALIKFLSELFELPKSAVKIVKGQTQPVKIIFLPIATEQLLRRVK